MNIKELKHYLENKYYIGFNVEQLSDGFNITLKESDKDKFYIKVHINESARLSADVLIEKYGASFLHLINKSSLQKRKNFVDLANSNVNGRIELLINKSLCSLDSFVEDNREWNSFEIRFVEFPFEYNITEINRAMDLLICLMLSLVDYSIEGFEEGQKKVTVSEKYERNPINRKICLAYKGYKCVICGFDFEQKYGIVGKDTIEVHHIVPVSKFDENYIVKPLEDLIPVCSNCHTMIHKKKIPYSPEEIKKMIEEQNN